MKKKAVKRDAKGGRPTIHPEDVELTDKQFKEMQDAVARMMSKSPSPTTYVGTVSSAFFKRIRGKRGRVRYSDVKGWNETKDRYTSREIGFEVVAGTLILVKPVEYIRKNTSKPVSDGLHTFLKTIPPHYEECGFEKMYIFTGAEWTLAPGYTPQEQATEEMMKGYK